MGGARASARTVKTAISARRFGRLLTDRERLCDGCKLNQSRHGILISFMLVEGMWHVAFLEADCRMSLGRQLAFANPDKIFNVARCGSADLRNASRCDLEIAMRSGRATLGLNLTPDQMRLASMGDVIGGGRGTSNLYDLRSPRPLDNQTFASAI
jgi:hypothetical protein